MKSNFETPDESPGFLLWHISTAWRSAIEATLKSMDLTHPQFVILATLGWLTRKGDLVTQRDVGNLAGLDPNTTSQIIKGLEKKGLIQREASSDARAKNPKLTVKGGRLVAKALPAVENADSDFFKNLSLKDLAAMIAIFQKLRD